MRRAIQNFRDLIVWQKAMKATSEVYLVTRTFPKEELFVLTAQIRRAAISIPSNIAEGHARQGCEFAHFLSIAPGPLPNWRRNSSSPSSSNTSIPRDSTPSSAC